MQETKIIRSTMGASHTNMGASHTNVNASHTDMGASHTDWGVHPWSGVQVCLRSMEGESQGVSHQCASIMQITNGARIHAHP